MLELLDFKDYDAARGRRCNWASRNSGAHLALAFVRFARKESRISMICRERRGHRRMEGAPTRSESLKRWGSVILRVGKLALGWGVSIVCWRLMAGTQAKVAPSIRLGRFGFLSALFLHCLLDSTWPANHKREILARNQNLATFHFDFSAQVLGRFALHDQLRSINRASHSGPLKKGNTALPVNRNGHCLPVADCRLN